MIGNNDLSINEATMIEAVQFWLDSKMVPPVPRITSVKSEKDYCGTVAFKVALVSGDEALV